MFELALTGLVVLFAAYFVARSAWTLTMLIAKLAVIVVVVFLLWAVVVQ